MALQQQTPRQADLVAPLAQLRAVDIVEIPDGEAAQEDAEAPGDHDPHLAQDLAVALLLARDLGLLRGRRGVARAHALVLEVAPPVVGPQVQLHDDHGADQHDGREQRVRVLVEGRVLQVVVVERDEDGQGGDAQTQGPFDQQRAAVFEGRPCHQAGRVDHGQLIHQLHWICNIAISVGMSSDNTSDTLRPKQLTLQGGMEGKASRADDEIPKERDKEDPVMAILDTIVHALEGQVDK